MMELRQEPLESILRPRIALSVNIKQRRIGALLLMVGLLLLVAGVLQVTSNLVNIDSLILKNVSPLLPFAGFILAGQGLVLLRFNGRRMLSWFMALPAVTFILAVGIF